MYTDLRERTYVMMNDEKVVIRRRGRCKRVRRRSDKLTCFSPPNTDFELYWPRGNRVARVLEGGEIAGINGFIHLIDGVCVRSPPTPDNSPPSLGAHLRARFESRRNGWCFGQRPLDAPLVGILLLDTSPEVGEGAMRGCQLNELFQNCDH